VQFNFSCTWKPVTTTPIQDTCTLLCSSFLEMVHSPTNTYFISQPTRYSDSLRAGQSAFRTPVWVRFSIFVQISRHAHPSSCTMGTVSLSQEQSGRCVGLSTHSLLELRLWVSGTIPLIPVCTFKARSSGELYCLSATLQSATSWTWSSHKMYLITNEQLRGRNPERLTQWYNVMSEFHQTFICVMCVHPISTLATRSAQP
jgi:hypothetical protein